MNKVFVGSLNWKINSQELGDHFSKAGEVLEAKVIVDRESGRSRGFGFVTFETSDEANEAVRMFNETEFSGRAIVVNIANARRETNNDRERTYSNSRW